MIIKCPECGHQVSDKAPVCPSCGVEIAGHIIKCSNCGELYLKEEGMCPNCHHVESIAQQSIATTQEEVTLIEVEEPITSELKKEEKPMIEPVLEEEEQEETVEPTQEEKAEEEPSEMTEEPKPVVTNDVISGEPPLTLEPVLEAIPVPSDPDKGAEGQDPTIKKRSHASLFVAILIAIFTAFVLLFIYNKTNPTGEKQDYELAIKSNDPVLLRQYLDNFPGAPINHRKNVQDILKKMSVKHPADNWDDVAKINTKAAYTKYLNDNPNTPHKEEIIAKIDEIDWQEAADKNTENAYLGYETMHPNGIHKQEADEKLKDMLVQTASKADQDKAVACVRQLLVGINTKSKDKISGAVASQVNFLGSPGSTSKEIFQYMRDKLYQADVKTINWHLGSPAEVITIQGEDGGMQIKVPAKLVIERDGGTSTKSYLVKAKIRNGHIYEVNWNQI